MRDYTLAEQRSGSIARGFMLSRTELVSNIYDCAVNDTRWDEIVDASVKQAGARGALLGTVNISGSDHISAQPEVRFSKIWREIPNEQIEYMRRAFLRYQIDTWKVLAQKERFGHVYDYDGYSDIDSLASREDYVFRRENLGIVRSVCFRLNDDRGQIDTLAAHFDAGYHKVPEQSQAILTELLPHYAKSLELSRVFNLLRNKYQAVLAALDHVVIGLCIVRPNRVVEICNSEAKRIFENTDLIKIDKNRMLIAKERQVSQMINQAIDQATNQQRLHPIEHENILRIGYKNEVSFLLEVTHLRDSEGELGEPLDGALVSIIDLFNTKEIKTERLTTLYSLTAVEQQVCSFVVQGLSRTEIAERREVSPQTVKTQISSIYTKLQVRTRTELIRLALKIHPPVERDY